MQSLKVRGDQLNNKEHDLRQSLANFEKYINVRRWCAFGALNVLVFRV